MAGSYPDVPGYRFPYDQDGTIAIWYNNPPPLLATPSELRGLNNDFPETSWGRAGTVPSHVCFLFPEKRNITGIILNREATTNNLSLEWSNDTTSGLDGTWNVAIAPYTGISSVDKLRLRLDVTSLAITDCTAIRFAATFSITQQRNLRNLHIYGSIASTESPDRLRIVDLTDDDIAAQLDFGNLAQRASATRQFKVINNSSSLAANNITVSLDAPTDSSPSLIGQYQISTDNVAFANAVNIGTLAPGTESGTMYIRNNVAPNMPLSIWSARIIANAVSWS